ncbi:four helix bundle protein [Ulvibacterium sp.]|uniref:four helix bundle protein n=1 Tax=Ulvibacterium sp. TaxID=2665914 RepID=UPI00345D881A
MIEERSFQFSLKISEVVRILRKNNEYVFADQLLKCSTSIGANVSEAGAGQ